MTQITNSVPMAVFGPGSLYVTRNDNAGPNTPVNIGYAQEFTYDESAESKELFGQNQYPLVIARGTIKSTGKMKAATISGLALAQVMFGQSFVSGALRASLAEPHAIPATPFQVVVAPPSSGTFDTDLGVLNAATGLPLGKVSSSPATGQYSVSAGTYTFAAADTGNNVLISYAYTVSGVGQKLVITNQPIGTTPSFQIDYVSTLYGQSYYVRMFAAVSTKLARSHKLTDFMMPEIDFGFFANAAGNVYEMSMDVVA